MTVEPTGVQVLDLGRVDLEADRVVAAVHGSHGDAQPMHSWPRTTAHPSITVVFLRSGSRENLIVNHHVIMRDAMKTAARRATRRPSGSQASACPPEARQAQAGHQ